MRVGMSSRRLRLRKSVVYIGMSAILCAAFVFFLLRASPIFSLRAADAASQQVRRVVNETAGAVFADYGTELVTRTVDSNGQISMISINSAEIVKIKAAFTSELISRLSDTTRTSIYISAGSLLNCDVLQGFGVRIPVKITFGSVSDVDISDEFIAAGINQTKHLVNMKVKISCAVISAFKCDIRDVEATFPLCENIIIGKVPQYYSDRMSVAAKGEQINEQGTDKGSN